MRLLQPTQCLEQQSRSDRHFHLAFNRAAPSTPSCSLRTILACKTLNYSFTRTVRKRWRMDDSSFQPTELLSAQIFPDASQTRLCLRFNRLSYLWYYSRMAFALGRRLLNAISWGVPCASTFRLFY